MVLRDDKNVKVGLSVNDIILALGMFTLSKHFNLNLIKAKDVLYVQSLVDSIPTLTEMDKLVDVCRNHLDNINQIMDYIRTKHTDVNEMYDNALSVNQFNDSKKELKPKKKRGRKPKTKVE